MYTYKIVGVSEAEHWVHIACCETDSTEEYESFASLIKDIAQMWNDNAWLGKISAVGEMRYIVNNDPLALIYQWDSLFGIIFEYPADANPEEIKAFLRSNYKIA